MDEKARSDGSGSATLSQCGERFRECNNERAYTVVS